LQRRRADFAVIQGVARGTAIAACRRMLEQSLPWIAPLLPLIGIGALLEWSLRRRLRFCNAREDETVQFAREKT
jgi:hypothetical protein